jgi:hypothetical protein
MPDLFFPSRRKLFSLGAAASAVGLLGMEEYVGAETRNQRQEHPCLNVREFGAVGDGRTDDTSAFQRALDAAHQAGGGTVHAPSGRYLFKGTLTVPDGVTLQGSFRCVPSNAGIRDAGEAKPGDVGTVFFVLCGRGQEDGTPFITLRTNSSLTGLTIFYPEQIADGIPVAYPWTIAMRGNNPAVFDLELLNPYQGIDACKSVRHNIRNVTGQPLRRGILVDEIYDIGRIENVHFNPWWRMGCKAYDWQLQNGEAFIFGRSDWEYVLNTFCYGYGVGYKFIETKTGACNGNFLGIGADNCNRAVLVEQCAPMALLIANGEFTSFTGEDPTMVDVRPSNRGVVRFSNSAFWGPCNQIAKISGKGTVAFSDCTFVEWGHGGDRAAIQAESGTVLVSGCEFRERKPHISLEAGVQRAVLMGNLFAGPPRIQNVSDGEVQIGLNAGSHE